MYWCRIYTPGSTTDYIEFSSEPGYNPMPNFSIGKTLDVDPLGKRQRGDTLISLRLYYVSGTTAQCLADYLALEAKLDNALADVRLFDVTAGDTPVAGNVFYEWLNSASHALGSDYKVGLRSPRVTVANPVQGRGEWSTRLDFDLQIRITEGHGDPDLSQVYAIDRQINKVRSAGRETIRYSIRASGPGAEAALADFRDEYATATGTDFFKEDETENIDDDSWTGIYSIETPGGGGGGGGGVTSLKETIAVEGGGREKSFSMTSGDGLPVEFDGPLRPVTVTITGEVKATKIEGLKIPNRDKLPGHEPDDSYEFSGSRDATVAGRAREYTGRYTQRFKLPSKNGISKILKIRELKDANGTGKAMSSGGNSYSKKDA